MDIKQYKRIDIPNCPEIELLGNLVLPSTMHSYSLCVEYIKEWFLNITGHDYFEENSVYVDGKYMFDDFVKMNDVEKIKRHKPILAIIPKIDHQYDKDHSYMKVLGVDKYIRRGAYINGFFKDFDNNLCLNMETRKIQINFDLIVRVSTRAQQVDLLNKLRMACRVGWTGGEYKDLDFHVPYELMMRLAKDAKFEIKNDKVTKPMLFLRYLNSHSSVPFTYKIRGINGKQEYFLRIKDCYIHTRYNDIDADDGERVGQISSNFNINMSLTCTFPCPDFYLYYSEYKDDIAVGTPDPNIRDTMAAYAIKITRFPDVDEHGWNLSMTTDIEEKDHSKPLEVDLGWLFQSDNDYNDILNMINYCKSVFISPDIFLNFKLYNLGDPVPCHVDWEKMILYTNSIVTSDINNFAIYVNYGFLNEQLVVMEDYYKNRIE